MSTTRIGKYLYETIVPKRWQISEKICAEQAQYGKARCQKCPVGGGCFHPRALSQPLPLWVWLCMGTTLAVPTYWALNPESARKLYYADIPEEEGYAKWRENMYSTIFKKVGLKHPDTVHIIETDWVDQPTTIGTDTSAGALIILPKSLLTLTNPMTQLRIPDPEDVSRVVYEG